jgi:chromosome segregation ATPase
MEKGDISRQINQQEMKINNISAQEHMISQNIEINTRAVKDTQDMIKMIQKQVSEKLRQKMKIETEIKELEEQMQTTEKEQTVVANMLKEKRKE